MSDFEKFLCFSSAMARCDGTESAEVHGSGDCRGAFSFLILSCSHAPPHFPFGHTAPSQKKNKGNFQNRSYHLIIDERNEKTDLNLSFTKETIGFYFQIAILAVDSL